MKRNIVFLDFDGVIVTMHSWNRATLEGLRSAGNRMSVDALNEITERGNAVIVVSSSWRIGETLDGLRHVLKLWGVVAEVIDVTPMPNYDIGTIGIPVIHSASVALSGTRGSEIHQWIISHKEEIENFVILDDNRDMEPYLDKLVQTKFADGLQVVHVALALEKLKPRENASARSGAGA